MVSYGFPMVFLGISYGFPSRSTRLLRHEDAQLHSEGQRVEGHQGLLLQLLVVKTSFLMAKHGSTAMSVG